MQWIDISLEQPQVAGKYLVKTRTTMGNTHKLEAGYTITNGKGHFNVSNQVVTHWLKEETIELNAKKLLKKHLDINIPKDKFRSVKQLAQLHYEASIDAINEALGNTK
jgi:hypothetical protein